VYVNHQTQTANQQLSKSNLQASKANDDISKPTVVNCVRWVKIRKEADQKNKDYTEKNTGKIEKSKKHRVLLLGDSHERGCSELVMTKLKNFMLLES
jgi:hypothetical protein